MFQDILLIDADSLYFRAGMVSTKKHEIRKIIKRTMDEIKKNCGVNNYMCAVKGEGNFRMRVDPNYKGHRKPLEPEVKAAVSYGLQHMIDEYGAIPAHDMEADDLVSIWAYEMMEAGNEPTIVAIDKDLLQIPGWHYNFVKKDPPRYVDADEANRLLMMQCLTGDSADNIKGLKGIGPKKAEKILEGVPMERRWDKVKAAYREHKASNLESDYILLKMLQSWSEYDNDILGKYPIIEESKPDENPTSKPEREATECEHNVSQEPTQDSSVQKVSDGDTGRTEGN
jgi:5'-3' exonuclease